ncbi:MAG TPA: hypothetical protein VMU01_03610 [Rhizomicrobium sp.]|nr:hypothetical protein [Rhizomicrobium sp.]
MRARLLAAALTLAAGCAFASGYDDFSAGVTANARGEADRAIASFTSALASGDLASGYLPSARLGRARAYLAKGDCTRALADLDEAVKLRPNSVSGRVMRAAAYSCLKNADAATADFNAALNLRPTARVYENYGRFQWNQGLFAEAAANYAQTSQMSAGSDPHLPYKVLWYAMSAERAGTLDQAKLNDLVSNIDQSGWPRPILDYYRNRLTESRVYEKAADSDATIANQQKCEADFYVGEWHLARKEPDAGMKLIHAAFGECPHNFMEYYAADRELKRQP